MGFVRCLLILSAAVVTGVVGYTAYLLRPSNETVSFPVRYQVTHIETTRKFPIEIDGKRGFVLIPAEVHEELPAAGQYSYPFAEPSAIQALRFYVLAGSALLLGLFWVGVVFIWLWYHARGKTPPKGIEIKLAAVLVYATGMVSGILLPQSAQSPVGRYAVPPPSTAVPSELGPRPRLAPVDTGPPIAYPAPSSKPDGSPTVPAP